MEVTHGRFRIVVDEYQYTLQVKYDGERKETGEKFEAYRDVGYYNNFERMLNKMVKMEMLAKHDKDKFSLEGFLKKYKEIMDAFKKEIVEPLNIK